MTMLNPLKAGLVYLGLATALGAFGAYARGVLADRAALRIEVAAQAETLKLASRHAKVTETVLSARVQSSAAIKERAKDVQAAIQVRLPGGPAGCVLPPDWRVLHDTAATDSELPPAPSGADGAPEAPEASASEALSTVAENYEIANDNADRLRKLQEWVRGVSEGPSEGVSPE